MHDVLVRRRNVNIEYHSSHVGRSRTCWRGVGASEVGRHAVYALGISGAVTLSAGMGYLQRRTLHLSPFHPPSSMRRRALWNGEGNAVDHLWGSLMRLFLEITIAWGPLYRTPAGSFLEGRWVLLLLTSSPADEFLAPRVLLSPSFTLDSDQRPRGSIKHERRTLSW